MEAQAILTVAHGLAQAANLSVEIREGGRWAWDPTRGALLVPRGDAEQLPRDVVLGLIAHEIGHALATRCHLFPLTGAPPWLAHRLANALEDPRVERVVAQRYAGARRWIAATRAHFQDHVALTDLHALAALDAFVLEGWAFDEGLEERARRASRAAPPVSAALAATRAARRRYTLDFTPPPSGPPRPDLVARYRQLGLEAACDGEAQLRALAFDAAQLAAAEILPAVVDLLELDVARLATALSRDPARQEQAIRTLQRNDPGFVAPFVIRCLRGLSGRPDPAPPEALSALARRLIAALFERAGARYGIGEGPPLSRAVASLPTHDDVIASLITRLHHLVPSRLASRSLGGARRGSQLDLRRAMAFEATRRDPKVFRRRDQLDARDAAAVLCVDLSGSMSGEKIAAAVHATHVFATVLRALAIPFEVLGFQDGTVVVVSFEDSARWTDDEALSARVEALTGEPDGRRIDAEEAPHATRSPRWTDIATALRAAATDLEVFGARDTLIFLLGDGEPNVPRRGRGAELHAVVAEVSAQHVLLGVGVGEGTASLTTWLPHAVTEVPPEQLHIEVGRLLEEALLAGAA
jgi:hypothetical protein